MKFKRFIAAVSAAVMSGMCMLSNLSAVNAEDYSSYDTGALLVSETEEQIFHSQFDESDCSVDLNNITSVPTACDLSTNEDSKYFPPIGNQGNVNSCTAWATTYYQYTYAANKLNNIESTVNSAYSPSWTYSLTNGGIDYGCYYTNVYQVLKNHGALTMEEMPYNSSSCDFSWSTDVTAMMNALHTRLSYYDNVTIPATGTQITSKTDEDLQEVKFLLCTGHILLVNINGLSWSIKNRFQNSSENVIYRAAESFGAHAMAVVGYNDNVCCDVNGNGIIEESERGAFKLANSAGAEWQNNGYIWVLYDSLNKISANTVNSWETNETGTRCSIFNYFGDCNTFHFIEVENYDVNLAGLLTVNTNSRNKLKVDLFRNSNSSLSFDENNSITYLTDFFHYGLEDDVYNTNRGFNGTLVFDYGIFDDPVNICQNGYYFGVNISNISSSNEEAFSNITFKIIDDEFNIVKSVQENPISILNGNSVNKSVKIQCLKGDIDYDGKVTANDSSVLLNYIAMINDLSNLQYYLADYNNDNDVNIADVNAINSSLLSNATQSELQQIKELNQKVMKYILENNYAESELEEVNELNLKIQQRMEVINYEEK